RAHWIGAGSTRGGARVHALMRLDREIKIGGAEGEDVLPLLCFRNGHDGGLAVTVSVLPFPLPFLHGVLLARHRVLAPVRARLPERESAPRRGRGAHVEGPPHRQRGGQARRRTANARDR